MDITLLKIYIIEKIIGSLLLAALYLYVLVATFSESKFIRRIAAFIFFSNLNSMIAYATRKPLHDCFYENICIYVDLIIWIHCICLALSELTLALSYWMLANEYY